ncbi:putative nucleoredoxin 2 [Vitis vinifera]|uniref:protein-disulfide reductase n=1 Tax=Vitis vinifera TaxID=29760 RepID=A0A438K475_VITVI|nr:putative nucleoredoxin 2 [Vitis vinifera]
MRKEVKETTSFKSEDGSGALNGVSDDLNYRSRFSSLLASTHRDFLLSPTGQQVKVSELNDKVIGLYFSANWYAPCRKFTQVLAGAYEQLKSCGAGFEIVFVSSDEDSDAFDNFRACMPWLAVPFSDLETKKALNRKFDIEGIPCLVILQPNDNKDEATLHDGVELIYRYGVNAFPFTKVRLEELRKEEREKHESQTLPNLLTNHNRDFLLGRPTAKQNLEIPGVAGQLNHYLPPVQWFTGHMTRNQFVCQYFGMAHWWVTYVQVPISSLIGKTIGLYFSAQWCLPGVKFTPKLISIYQKIKQTLVDDNEEDFEIVFVSSDRDQPSFDSYFGTMPWLAVPFGDPTIKTLTKYFDVQGIPCLVILGPDGKTVTKQGRYLINLYQENAYPFTEAKLELLEKQMDEEAKSLPRSEYHAGHRHELTLVSEGTGGGPFICCDCDEQGLGWAYQCLECGYEVHPKCMRVVDRGSTLER